MSAEALRRAVVPDGWTATTLGEQAQFIGGSQPPKDTFSFEPKEGFVRLLQIRDYRTNSYPTYAPLDHPLTKRFCEKDDIMIGRYGPPIFQIFRGLEGAYNVALMKALPAEGVDRDYLFHVLRQPDLLRMLESVSARTAGQSGVDMGKLKAYPLLLPPLPEQKRIAAILDKADEIRRKRAEAIKLTEELLRSAFLEMCGPNSAAYESWPEVLMADLASPHKGAMRTGPFGSDLRHSEFADSGIAVLGIDNAVQNRFAWDERRFITKDKYEKLKRYTVYPGDVIITIMGTTGRCAVVPEDIPTAITTKHLATISIDRDKAEPEFVAQALHRHPDVLRQIEGAQRGAIMNGLNLGLIKSLVLRLPPLADQKRFSAFTAKIRAHHQLLGTGLENDLGASLTQRAFAGNL